MVSTRSKTYDVTKTEKISKKIRDKNEDKNEDKQEEYIDNKTWISASRIKNYMIQDPLIDWLQMYYNKENKEKKGNFTEYLMGKGIEFEKQIMEIIKRKIGKENVEQVSYGMKDIMSVNKAKETIRLMKEGKPIIYQGVLHDISRKRYGSPDILIRSDWINKIVNNKIISKDLNERAERLNTKYHYRVIDIKYMTLQLKADGYHILNSDLYQYYNGQVFYYTKLLGRIQGYMPLDGYLLGRGNTHRKRKHTY